jgi:hypothetical protein
VSGKRKLTKAEYDALDSAVQLLYIADDNGYKLSLIDDDDPDALRRARDREKQTAKDLKDKVDALTVELDKLREPARKSGDIVTLEKSWTDKFNAESARLTAVINQQKELINSTLIDHAATQFAGSVTAKPDAAALLLPHVRSRFEVVYDGDVPTVKVKDASGKLSAMTTADLQKEIVADPKYATVVVASKASGAGGSGARGISVPGRAGATPKKFSEMNGVEKSELFKSDPNYFSQLAAEDKAAQAQTRFDR